PTAPRNFLVHAPEIIVGPLLGAGHAERALTHAKRTADVEYALDRAVLAGRVDALKNNQKGALTFREQKILKPVDFGAVFGRRALRFVAHREQVAALRRLGVELGRLAANAGGVRGFLAGRRAAHQLA